MDPERCPACVAPCRVAVAVTHPAMRTLIVELLDRDDDAWSVIAVADPDRLPAVFAEAPAELVVVDGADFPACCRDRLGAFRLDQVVVIGAEPGDAYRVAALHEGAGAWLPRDRVGEELVEALHDALARAQERRAAAGA